MLQILLLILKIIGIIIAVILGILVLLVCIILCVPIRYQAEAGSDGTIEGIHGKIRVTWLLYLVSLLAVYENRKMRCHIRIAWKRISQENEMEEKVDTDETDQESGLEKEEKAAAEVEKTVEEREKVSEEVKEQPQIPQAVEKERKESEKAVEEGKTSVVPQDEGDAKDNEADQKEGPSLFQTVSGRIRGFFKKIKYTFEKLCGKIKILSEKKEKVEDFITDEVHKNAFRKVKKEGLTLLSHILPKKVKGRVHYGFEDPCRTGQVLAGLSVVYPWIGESLLVDPDFEKRVLEGELCVRGRIRLVHIALAALRLFWSKDVRVTYRHIRSFK
nr:DUF2953 domain-containing protein [uncultured Merdimonas sp.]